MEKAKCCKSKHVVVSVLIIFIIGFFFGLLGYLLGSKNNNVVIENNSTKNATVNQNNEEGVTEVKNEEDNESENLKEEKIDWETYSSKENNFEFMLPKEYAFSGVFYNGDKGGSGDVSSSDEEIKLEPVGNSIEYIEGDNTILYWNVKDSKSDIVFKMIKQFRAKAGSGTLSEIAMNYPTPKDKITNITLVELNSGNTEIIKQKFDISDPLLQSGPWYYVANDEFLYVFITDEYASAKDIEEILSTFKFTESNETANWKTYINDKYGFEVTLLDLWKGYSVLTETWSGTTLNGSSTKYQGPQIIIRNPKWSASKPWQDIPVMVFTKNEWSLIEAQNLNVNAAPIGPQKLDENQKYVFALPPRWTGFTDTLGQNEAQEIAKTIKAINF